MKKKVFLAVGAVLFLSGVILIINSFSNITGLVIVEEINLQASSIIGILILILGIVFVFFGRERKIRLYHAFPAGEYRAGQQLDNRKLAHGGFYMAQTEADAVLAVRETHPFVEPNRISVVEVDIPEEEYDGLIEHVAGTSSAPYAMIPPKNFDDFNRLLKTGKITIKKAEPSLEDIAAYS